MWFVIVRKTVIWLLVVLYPNLRLVNCKKAGYMVVNCLKAGFVVVN